MTISQATGQKTMAGSTPVVIASDQTQVQVVGGTTSIPLDSANYVGIRQLPQVRKFYGFNEVISGGVSSDLVLNQTGTNQTVNQSAGSLVIVTGTTARSETIIRSVDTWKGDLSLRHSTILSQRVANTSFYIELVDVIGDALAYTINSATAITVTIPSNPFTAANVGQFVTLQGFSGTGTFLADRYAIASVAGNNVVFTVSGFAVGTGTLSLTGWNNHTILYNGTTATQNTIWSQNDGYVFSNFPTINTTASPGHVGVLNVEGGIVTYSDQLIASSTTQQTTVRASLVDNIARATSNLYLQIRCVNGTAGPSTTTWTIGFIDVENYIPSQVSLTSARSQSYNASLPVNIQGTPIVTMTSTTITAVTPGTFATALGKAEDSAHATTDTGVAVWSVRRDTLNGTPPTNASGDYQQFSTDPDGAMWSRLLAIYNATPPTVTTTQKTDLQTDVNANLRITNAPGSFFQALYNDVDISVKGTAGVFKSVYVTNINLAVRYFQVIDKATAPVGGDTALFSIPIPAGTVTIPGFIKLNTTFFGLAGLACATGIAIGISTTAGIFTAATTTDHTVSGTYV